MDNSQLDMFQETKVPPAWVLNDGQEKALDRLMLFSDRSDPWWKITLEGFAGTGKTFTINRFVEKLRKLHPRINFGMTAPTHKAVRQLKKHSELRDQLEFGTIHSFLGLTQHRDDKTGKITYKPNKDAKWGRKIDSVDILIIDESSMLDDDLYEYIEDGCKGKKIIFMGDSLQIPPVGKKQRTGVAMAIPFDPYQRQSRKIDYIVLTEIVRQGAGNPIIEYGAAIREQVQRQWIDHEFSHTEDSGVELIGKSRVALEALFRKYFCTPAFKADPDYVKGICWRNSSVDYFNTMIRNLVFGRTDLPGIIKGDQLVLREAFVEDKRVVIANNEELEVKDVQEGVYIVKYQLPIDKYRAAMDDSNSDGLQKHELHVKTYICHVQIPDDESFDVLIMHEDHVKEFEQIREKLKAKALSSAIPYERGNLWNQYYNIGKDFIQADYNYCITGHRSQGSTYDYCISMEWDINECRDYEERNRIKYVAATRARNKLFVIR